MRIKKICERCGQEFEAVGWAASKQKYCIKCQSKRSPPTQEVLARRANRKINKNVDNASKEAYEENKSYGYYMAEKTRKKGEDND